MGLGGSRYQGRDGGFCGLGYGLDVRERWLGRSSLPAMHAAGRYADGYGQIVLR